MPQCFSCAAKYEEDHRYCWNCGDRLDGEELYEASDIANMLGVTISWVEDHSTEVTPILPSVTVREGSILVRRYRQKDFIRFLDEHLVMNYTIGDQQVSSNQTWLRTTH